MPGLHHELVARVVQADQYNLLDVGPEQVMAPLLGAVADLGPRCAGDYRVAGRYAS